MTLHDPAPERNCRLFHDLEHRWKDLELPLWSIASDGATRSQFLTPGWNLFCNSQVIQSQLRLRFEQRLSRKKAEISELLPGVLLAQIASPIGGARGGRFATIILTSDVTEGSLPPASSGLPRVPVAQASALARLFASTVTDLGKSIMDTDTLGQYTERLAQAYEETNLLFRLSRLLNLVEDPRVALKGICTQIQQVLPFAWMAVLVDSCAEQSTDLGGDLILSGECPSPELVRGSMKGLLNECRGKDNWTKVLSASDHSLAALLDTELVVEPLVQDRRAIGVLVAGNKGGSDPKVSSFELQFLDAAADFLGVFHLNVSRFAEQKRMFMGTLRALTASIDAKDPYTGGHSDRVGLLAAQMAMAMNLSHAEIEIYRIAGMVHDVGKIGVPEAVLRKAGKLDDEEFAQIKRHPEIGYQILRDIPGMEDVLPGVVGHHEKWNGRGYPHGLAGESVPLLGRVLALCDTFDAMSSTRSYRAALPRHHILSELKRCGGEQFDPALTDLFVRMNFTEFDQMLASTTSVQSRAA